MNTGGRKECIISTTSSLPCWALGATQEVTLPLSWSHSDRQMCRPHSDWPLTIVEWVFRVLGRVNKIRFYFKPLVSCGRNSSSPEIGEERKGSLFGRHKWLWSGAYFLCSKIIPGDAQETNPMGYQRAN